MITKRTNSDNPDFQELVKTLDLELKIRDGEDHAFYAALNKTDAIKHVIVVYEENKAVGCGSFREYAPGIMEIKRMYVPKQDRNKGIASIVLKKLELWCRELGIEKCILETGINQPEAIHLYKKNGYQIIANYGAYMDMETSVCFEKEV
jgi:GNAT superfamily N-acetyltransferase